MSKFRNSLPIGPRVVTYRALTTCCRRQQTLPSSTVTVRKSQTDQNRNKRICKTNPRVFAQKPPPEGRTLAPIHGPGRRPWRSPPSLSELANFQARGAAHGTASNPQRRVSRLVLDDLIQRFTVIDQQPWQNGGKHRRRAPGTPGYECSHGGRSAAVHLEAA